MKRLLFIVVFMFLHNGAFAQSNTFFEKATEAYNNGEFQKAIELYERILENNQHSAALYFNLGNAFYKKGEIGPSIYYYEKALLLNPNDAEIKNNLGYAQNMRLDAIEEMPQTAFTKFYNNTIALLSFEQWAYLAIAMVLLFVIAYIAYYSFFGATQKRVTFIISVIAIIICFSSVAFAYLQFEKFKKDNPAIIFSREIAVTSEPNKRSERIFTLHEGTKVNVLETLDDWQKIKIADGQTGWLPSENLKMLKDF